MSVTGLANSGLWKLAKDSIAFSAACGAAGGVIMESQRINHELAGLRDLLAQTVQNREPQQDQFVQRSHANVMFGMHRTKQEQAKKRERNIGLDSQATLADKQAAAKFSDDTDKVAKSAEETSASVSRLASGVKALAVGGGASLIAAKASALSGGLAEPSTTFELSRKKLEAGIGAATTVADAMYGSSVSKAAGDHFADTVHSSYPSSSQKDFLYEGEFAQKDYYYDDDGKRQPNRVSTATKEKYRKAAAEEEALEKKSTAAHDAWVRASDQDGLLRTTFGFPSAKTKAAAKKREEEMHRSWGATIKTLDAIDEAKKEQTKTPRYSLR